MDQKQGLSGLFSRGLRGLASQRRVGPIGIRLGYEQLSFLQLEQAGDGLKVRCAGAADYPGMSRDNVTQSPAHFKTFLHDIAKRHSTLHGRTVVTGLPPEKIKLAMVNYRIKSGQSDDLAVVEHMKDRLAGNINDWVIDYFPIRRAHLEATDRSALVAAAKRTDIIDLLELFRLSGFEVEALEIGPVAIRRLASYLRSGQTFENILLLNVGQYKSYLTVLWGRRLLLDRELDFGRKRLLQTLSETLDLPAESAAQLLSRFGFRRGAQIDDATTEHNVSETVTEILKPEFLSLVEDINKALIYTASETRGGAVAYVYLLGCMADWPGAGRFLGSLLSIPVAKLDPFSGFVAGGQSFGDNPREHFSGFVMAAGHALRGIITHVGV